MSESELGTLSAADVRELVGTLELSLALKRERLGTRLSSGAEALLARWQEIMERAGIDRYGSKGPSIRLTVAGDLSALAEGNLVRILQENDRRGETPEEALQRIIGEWQQNKRELAALDKVRVMLADKLCRIREVLESKSLPSKEQTNL